MQRFITVVFLFTAVLLFTAPALAQGDLDVVEFHLPGHFDQAVARARDEQRLLLVKGVAFGVDELGATCATKGKW